MTVEDHRVVMSLNEFLGIPVDDGDPAYHYFDKFYRNNEKVNQLSDADIRTKLSPGLKALFVISFFDGQVGNGGITQFFWNCPGLIADVCESIELLGQHDLLANYETACGALYGNKDLWIKLRDEAYRDEANPDWNKFSATYELLDLGWFDKKYWESYDPNEPGLKVIDPGMRTPLLRALSDYVRSHPNEYIAEPLGG